MLMPYTRRQPPISNKEFALRRVMLHSPAELQRLGRNATSAQYQAVFGGKSFTGFDHFDLSGIDESSMPLLIIQNQRLPIGADRNVVEVRNDEGSLAVQHNPNRPKRLGMHQIFDVVGNHSPGT